MQNPLQITFHDLRHVEDIETAIHEKFAKLNAMNMGITKCHVTLEKLSKHHNTANMACVRLDLKVAHFEDIVVNEKCTEDDISLKSAVLRVFKDAQLLARKEFKKHQDQKRVPRPGKFEIEKVEEEPEIL